MRGSTVGGWALIVGAGCFALFWSLALTSLDESVATGPSRPATAAWLPALALHATTIASLTIGLGLLARDLRRAREARLVATLGAALTVVGLITVFPLIPVGLGLVAIGLMGVRYPRAATGSLLVGSVGMVILYVALYQQQAGRVFGEGAPPFQLGPKLIFQASVILLAAGLAAIGFQLRRRNE